MDDEQALFTHSFDDGVTCTLLPPARVAGLTWVVLVVESSNPELELSETWHMGVRFRFEAGGAVLEAESGGGGGSDEQWLDHYAFAERAMDLVLLERGAEVARTSISMSSSRTTDRRPSTS